MEPKDGVSLSRTCGVCGSGALLQDGTAAHCAAHPAQQALFGSALSQEGSAGEGVIHLRGTANVAAPLPRLVWHRNNEEG